MMGDKPQSLRAGSNFFTLLASKLEIVSEWGLYSSLCTGFVHPLTHRRRVKAMTWI